MQAHVPFAMETVFSHCKEHEDGSFESRGDLIRDIQAAGYFVVLFFVGQTDTNLSILRVRTRIAGNGHAVDESKLRGGFQEHRKPFDTLSRWPTPRFLLIIVGMRHMHLQSVLFVVRPKYFSISEMLRRQLQSL